jgi:hypothetical protein
MQLKSEVYIGSVSVGPHLRDLTQKGCNDAETPVRLGSSLEIVLQSFFLFWSTNIV